MIILDTNVVSELMRPVSSPEVLMWFDNQEAESLYLTATSLAELLSGISAMPTGRRQTGLFDALHELRVRLINPHILPLDQHSATAYGSLTSLARTRGRAISIADGQIAAIAKVHGFTVATRDTSPFQAAGVAFVDPWDG